MLYVRGSCEHEDSCEHEVSLVCEHEVRSFLRARSLINFLTYSLFAQYVVRSSATMVFQLHIVREGEMSFVISGQTNNGKALGGADRVRLGTLG